VASARTLRALVAVTAVAAFGTIAGTSGAQVPPVPVPEEAKPALEVTGPIAGPACGNAILAATILAGTAPPQAREALEIATANVFVACGQVPVAPRAQTRCVDDEVLATVLAQVGGVTIGGALPVAPPSTGQVVDAITILQEHFPVPADDEGLLASLAAALDCRFATTSAPKPGAVPSPPDDLGAGPQPTDGGPGLVPTGVGGTIPLGVLPPLADEPPLAAPIVPISSSSGGRPRPVGYPILLAPVIIGAAAVIVGRGLLARRAGAG
jgi:hypothetical protein